MAIQTAINRTWSRREGTFEKAVITLRFIYAVRRRRDRDNLIASFKPGLDAIVRTGLIPDDSQERVRFGSVEAIMDKARAPLTEIIIMPDWTKP